MSAHPRSIGVSNGNTYNREVRSEGSWSEMSRKKLIAGGIVLLAVVVAVASMFTNSTSQMSSGKGKVGVIPIEGTIMGGQQSLFASAAASEDIMSQIRAAAKDPSVKAVVLRINSPGGGVAATQEITRELEKLKETGKPVITSMGDTAASGGYWLAATSDKIYANEGTLTGSIGVIMTIQNLEELYKKLGMDFEVFKSGPYKDIGSTSREMTPEERNILQGMVDEIFSEFVDVVAKGRNLPREDVEKLATGRVYTGNQALEVKLVDEIGNYYDAVKEAGRMAGIKGEPAIKVFGQKGMFDSLLEGKLNGTGLAEYLSGTEKDSFPKAVGPMLLAIPSDL